MLYHEMYEEMQCNEIFEEVKEPHLRVTGVTSTSTTTFPTLSLNYFSTSVRYY